MCMYDVCEITYIREINDNGRNTNTIIKNLLIVHTHISENIRFNGAPLDSDCVIKFFLVCIISSILRNMLIN